MKNSRKLSKLLLATLVASMITAPATHARPGVFYRYLVRGLNSVLSLVNGRNKASYDTAKRVAGEVNKAKNRVAGKVNKAKNAITSGELVDKANMVLVNGLDKIGPATTKVGDKVGELAKSNVGKVTGLLTVGTGLGKLAADASKKQQAKVQQATVVIETPVVTPEVAPVVETPVVVEFINETAISPDIQPEIQIDVPVATPVVTEAPVVKVATPVVAEVITEAPVATPEVAPVVDVPTIEQIEDALIPHPTYEQCETALEPKSMDTSWSSWAGSTLNSGLNSMRNFYNSTSSKVAKRYNAMPSATKVRDNVQVRWTEGSNKDKAVMVAGATVATGLAAYLGYKAYRWMRPIKKVDYSDMPKLLGSNNKDKVRVKKVDYLDMSKLEDGNDIIPLLSPEQTKLIQEEYAQYAAMVKVRDESLKRSEIAEKNVIVPDSAFLTELKAEKKLMAPFTIKHGTRKQKRSMETIVVDLAKFTPIAEFTSVVTGDSAEEQAYRTATDNMITFRNSKEIKTEDKAKRLVIKVLRAYNNVKKAYKAQASA